VGNQGELMLRLSIDLPVSQFLSYCSPQRIAANAGNSLLVWPYIWHRLTRVKVVWYTCFIRTNLANYVSRRKVHRPIHQASQAAKRATRRS
jgi:hypothetical protein